MHVIGFRHTGIICKDLKKSLRFYKDYLGLKVIQEMNDDSEYINKITQLKNAKVRFIKLKMKDNTVLELLSYLTHPTKEIKKPIHNIGLLHLALRVKNIDKTYKYLKSKKIKFLSKPILSSEKIAKVCFCLDPDNVRVELVEMLK